MEKKDVQDFKTKAGNTISDLANNTREILCINPSKTLKNAYYKIGIDNLKYGRVTVINNNHNFIIVNKNRFKF